jgi:hypothetical protein
MNDIIISNLAYIALSLLDRLKDYTTIIVVIASIYSTLQCFFGYRTFKFWVGVQGFILFGMAGILVGYLSFREEMELYLIMGLILGGLGALLAMELYKIGVFLQCFWAGSLIGVLIALVGQFEIEQIASTVVMLGIVIGTIGLILIKPLIILSTGFSGGMVLGYIASYTNNLEVTIGVYAGVILSILGILYQLYSDEQLPNVSAPHDDKATNQSI